MDAVVAMILSDVDMFTNYIKPEVDKYDKNELMKFDTLNPIELPDEIKNLLPVSSALEKKKLKKGPEE